MNRLAGIDLNGWRDLAVRNWLAEPAGHGDIADSDETTHVVSGGIGASVVEIGEKEDTALVGGVQGLLAPHGRGGGWGRTGAKQRVSVGACLAEPEAHVTELAAAFAGMGSMRRATVVAAIPDVETSDENHQEALLTALARLRPRTRLLVWRSVLATLYALSKGIAGVSEAAKVSVISHDGEGFTTQVLRLRRGAVLAPERRHFGRRFSSPWRLEALRQQVQETLAARIKASGRRNPIETSALPVQIALGEDPAPEPLRLDNGDWVLADTRGTLELPDQPLPPEIAKAVADCDVVLFESPSAGRVRKALEARLSDLIPGRFCSLPPDAIGHGAHEAARRHARGVPIFYDFLPQISTIVMTGREARNFDLIPEDALLPAGEVYRSEKPAQLSIPAGAKDIRIFLKKQTDPTPRRATVTLPSRARGNIPVELHVQQAPAAGRARLTLVSKLLDTPFQVDWDSAEVLEDTDWQALIREQRPQLPTIPHHLVLPCGTGVWSDLGRRPGLLTMLEEARRSGSTNWKTLADKLTSRHNGYYAISSKGELPEALPRHAGELLDWAIGRAEQELRDRARHGEPAGDVLRFLTWTFQLCPGWVVDDMIEALATNRLRPSHLARTLPTLLFQGVGRTAVESEQQRKVFNVLMALPDEAWKKDQMACAAFLLSRTDTAPRLLDSSEVARIAEIAEAKIREACDRPFTSRYFYGPFLLVGLLRCRLREPWALVAGLDPIADRLLDATKNLAETLERTPSLNHYTQILHQVCDELRGRGSNPDLLARLEAMTGS